MSSIAWAFFFRTATPKRQENKIRKQSGKKNCPV
jgi:hypothetical protein